ncbi:MAG: transposase [Bacteroidota bacterium]|nr:transposase [Bacteroidota bacterium]
MKKSEKGIKKFTLEEKVAILHEAQQKGVKETLAKYGLYPATYYYWKRNHTIYGESGLRHKKSKDQEKQIQLLEQQNMQLKILLAEKELENSLKDLQFKKSQTVWKKQI